MRASVHACKRVIFLFFGENYLMTRVIRLLPVAALMWIGSAPMAIADDDDDDGTQKQLEEVVIYGQRVEATVSDTSIAITAMDENFLKDMGIQGPNELVNFIPATTRTDWDIKIRGVGRNFRGLGGDPGVGTYYNGIYNPDFGIASTEGGLYDIKRIEVLRGPQGTLYGRNSIGGVVNYVTNKPNHDEFESQIRVVLGQYNTNEWYGVVSGPVTDSVAYRLVGVKRRSDGHVEGLNSQDLEDINDQNFALTLEWDISDVMNASLRVNDRRSLRAGNFGNGGHAVLGEGPCVSDTPVTSAGQCDPRYRVTRDTSYYAPGFRTVIASYPGAIPFVHPVTGNVTYATNKRPGVDPVIWPYSPSPNYACADCARYNPGDLDTPTAPALSNDFVDEEFDHQAASFIFKWDLRDDLSIAYLANYQSFEYWFDRDNDFSNSKISSVGDTVVEYVWSWSQELRVFWELGDRWTATTGFYNFLEDRDQFYGIRNRLGKGFVNNAALYGTPDDPDWVRRALPWVPANDHYKNRPLNAPGFYSWYNGDQGKASSHRDDIGAVYEHDNNIQTENIAFYTQGDYQIRDNLSVTLGIRWSKDHRDALEQRGGYSEIGASDFIKDSIIAAAPAGYDTSGLEAVSPLAVLNVAMGAATLSGDPDTQITPVCPLTALTCDRPLRLGGLPIAWGSRGTGEYDTDSITYRINFNYEPTDNTLVYLGVTSGYRAGGFNMGGSSNRVNVTDTTGAAVQALSQYGDEDVKSYELGYKGSHFDNTVQVNTAIYVYDYENYQDHVERWESEAGDFALPPGVAAPGGRGPVSVTTNIPQAFNTGFEVDVVWLAMDNLTLGGNYSYTISEYDFPFTLFNENDPRYPRSLVGGEVNQDPCTLPAEVRVLYCKEVDGVQLTGIPKNKGTVWGSYEWDIGYGTLTLYGSLALTDEFWTSQFARPWDRVPERRRLDLRVSFLSSDQKWTASLFVDNVLDETFIRWSDMEPRRTGYGINFPQRVVTLSPRYIGVEATYNFN